MNKLNDRMLIQLFQNYPNPFNPKTIINNSVPKFCFLTLKVYDILGKEIKTLMNYEVTAGGHKIDFGGSELTSGIYFLKIQAGNFTETKKLILLK